MSRQRELLCTEGRGPRGVGSELQPPPIAFSIANFTLHNFTHIDCKTKSNNNEDSPRSSSVANLGWRLAKLT
ncbi:unnamed protein product [Ceratitis capitata]|uniref:(Mediterranean fruit fly) hypothetical protein n=1 Tax=Ceratitis capitata TaxID=7213 RepID=A0A811UH04_CERCA|nr:unnamed protein product [Ceratitis capitata]